MSSPERKKVEGGCYNLRERRGRSSMLNAHKNFSAEGKGLSHPAGLHSSRRDWQEGRFPFSSFVEEGQLQGKSSRKGSFLWRKGNSDPAHGKEKKGVGESSTA